MPTRIALLIVLVALALSQPASAGLTSPTPDRSPDGQRQQAGGAVSEDTVEVYAADSTLTTQNVPSGSAPARPRCTYTRLTTWVPGDVDGNGGAGDLSSSTAYRDRASKESAAAAGPGIEQLAIVKCPGDAPRLRWLPTDQDIDITQLIRTAHNKARATLPTPAPAMNPAPEHGVPAQMGLWLAVDDPGQVNVIAQVGPVWASVTARFVTVVWDLGGGVVIDCGGLGTPYPVGSSDPEQGPCGYTFTKPSELGTHQVTATTHWDVWLETSTGQSRSLGPATTSTTFEYQVYEIVTIGAPGN